MRKLTLTLLTLMIALPTFYGVAGRAQSCGDTLLADTTLTASLTCTGSGLIVGADDITLDCANFTITGSGTDIGILLDGRTGVTVENCTAINFTIGFLLTGSPSNYLTSNGAVNNTSSGSGAFQLSSGSDGNVLEGNRSSNNAGRGFAVIDSTGNMLIDNAATANGFRGFDLIDATGNALVLNIASQNTSAGVVVQGTSEGNILYRNRMIGNLSEGVATFSSVNYLSFNRANGNSTFGFTDFTGANFYLLNGCVGNTLGPSNPAGLCP